MTRKKTPSPSDKHSQTPTLSPSQHPSTSFESLQSNPPSKTCPLSPTPTPTAEIWGVEPNNQYTWALQIQKFNDVKNCSNHLMGSLTTLALQAPNIANSTFEHCAHAQTCFSYSGLQTGIHQTNDNGFFFRATCGLGRNFYDGFPMQVTQFVEVFQDSHSCDSLSRISVVPADGQCVNIDPSLPPLSFSCMNIPLTNFAVRVPCDAESSTIQEAKGFQYDSCFPWETGSFKIKRDQDINNNLWFASYSSSYCHGDSSSLYLISSVSNSSLNNFTNTGQGQHACILESGTPDSAMVLAGDWPLDSGTFSAISISIVAPPVPSNNPSSSSSSSDWSTTGYKFGLVVTFAVLACASLGFVIAKRLYSKPPPPLKPRSPFRPSPSSTVVQETRPRRQSPASASSRSASPPPPSSSLRTSPQRPSPFSSQPPSSTPVARGARDVPVALPLTRSPIGTNAGMPVARPVASPSSTGSLQQTPVLAAQVVDDIHVGDVPVAVLASEANNLRGAVVESQQPNQQAAGVRAHSPVTSIVLV